MVFPNGGAVFGFDAFAGHTRAHHFAQAIDVDRVQPHALLNGAAHVVGPGLGAKNANAQRAVCGDQSLALKLIGNRQHVAGGDHDDVGFEVGDELHLALGLPAAKGHHGEAEFFCAIVRAQATGEQTIAIAHMHQVARSRTRSADAARHQVCPGVDVIARVTDHRGFAGGATGGMDAGALRARHGKHAIRITVAQIEFGGEGKARQIGEALAIAGVHTGRIKLGFVNR